ncbi:hypothetical protein TNCV_1815031, partial [Trichonephila clavipes]
MHPDLERETQIEQILDLGESRLRGTPGVNHVHTPTPAHLSHKAKLNFNLVV